MRNCSSLPLPLVPLPGGTNFPFFLALLVFIYFEEKYICVYTAIS